MASSIILGISGPWGPEILVFNNFNFSAGEIKFYNSVRNSRPAGLELLVLPK